MIGEEFYKNGQRTHTLENNVLTYFYKNGKVRATGPYINNMMEGEWVFYRETGQLWAVGNFLNNQQHGDYVRYNRQDEVEVQAVFVHGKKQKPSKAKPEL